MKNITNSRWTWIHGDKEINESNKDRQVTKEFDLEVVLEEGQSRMAVKTQE
jgi:hypothetical protein